MSRYGKGEKPSEGQYETFDSGDGPTVPDGMEADFDHCDSSAGLDGYCQGAVDDMQGSVPEVPSKKR